MTKITCIGAGYVGGPTMAVIADQCPDVKIYIYDINEELVARWNAQDLPIYEKGLDEIIARIIGKNLFFTTNFEEAMEGTDMVFLAVNTPTKTKGKGSGMACNTKYLENVIRNVSRYYAKVQLDHDVILIEKSTVPITTCLWVEKIFREEQILHPANKERLIVLSNPEFLAEGTAIQDLLKPDRVVIGGRKDAKTQAGLEKLKDIYSQWIPKERILTSNAFSSELGKLVANSFLSQRISSINSISMICEKTGADIDEVAKNIGSDMRIGKHFLKPSVGFGGSCFQKDCLHLVYLADSLGLPEVAEYWRMVIKINDLQKNRFSDLIITKMFNNLTDKIVCVYGVAFKKDSNDVRATAALDVIYNLLQEEAIIHVYDPKVTKNEFVREMKYTGLWRDEFDKSILWFESPYGASILAHAIAVLTEWDEFNTYDYTKIYSHMTKPALIFDGRRIIDSEKLQKIGFETYTIGSYMQH